jgi:CheY-like chemotaxis protein
MNKKHVVLLVDDDRDQLLTISTIIEMEGYEVIACNDPSSALELVRQKKIDAVVADIRMPKLDGPALAQQIKALPGKESLPVILVTASPESVEFSSNQVKANSICVKQELKRKLPQMLRDNLK